MFLIPMLNQSAASLEIGGGVERLARRRSASAWRSICLILMLVAGIFAAPRPAEAQTQYFYDAAGRLSAVLDPVNGTAVYSYDAVGNILGVATHPITALVVAGVAPPRGAVGATVAISGTSFGTKANTGVAFNGVAAVPVTVTSTLITVAVPAGATTGPITVTSPAGSAKSAFSFVVTAPTAPTISSFSPAIVAAGAPVTISGSGFNANAALDKVLVNGRFAQVTAASGASLTAQTSLAATSGYVTVATPGGSATSTTYLAVAPPGYTPAEVSSVTPSSLGGTPTSSIAASGDVGLVLFDAPAGQRVAVSVTGSTEGGTLYFYAPDGTQFAQPLGIGAGNSTGAVNLTLPGTYEVVFVSGAAGSVSLNIIPVAPEATAPIVANATPVSLTTTTAYQGMQLTFSGTAGQVVSLLVNEPCSSQPLDNTVLCGNNGTTPQSLSVALAGSPNNPVFISSNYGNLNITGAEQIWTNAFTLPTTGTYTITLTVETPNQGTAIFTLSTVPTTVTPITATATPVAVTTTAYGQSAILTFNASQAEYVSLLVNEQCSTQVLTNAVLCGSNSNTPQTLVITTPNGSGGTTTVYSSSNWGNLNIAGAEQIWTGSVMLPAAGSYTITLTNQWANVGTATFTLSTDPTTVTPIQANATPVNVTTTAYGQSAILSFTTTQSEYVSLLVNEPCSSQALTNAVLCASNSNTPQTLTITTPNGSGGTTTVFSSSNWGNLNIAGAEQIWTGSVQLLAPGNYTITLTNQWANIGSATFTLSTDPTTPVPILTNAVPVGVTTTAYGQSDILTFTTSQAEYVSLLVNEPCSSQPLTNAVLCGSDSTTPQTLTVTMPNGSGGTSTIYSSSNWGNLNISGAEQIWTGAFMLPAAATYTITLTNQWANVGSANFTLSLDPQTVVPIKANAVTVQDTTTAAGQSDLLSFNGTAGETVSLLVNEPCSTQPLTNAVLCGSNSNTPQILTVTTTSTNGTTTAYSSANWGNLNISGAEQIWTGAFSLPISGAYTITLTNQWANVGTANFTLSKDPTNTVAITDNGSATTVTTTAEGQSALLSFAGTAGQTVALLVSENCSNTTPAWCTPATNTPQNLTITTPNGSGGTTTVYSTANWGNYNTSTTEENWTGAITLPTTGTYTITLTDQWTNYGPVTFYLYNDNPADVLSASSIGAAPVTVSTTTPGQSAGITFTGTASESVHITVNPLTENPSGNCRTVSLLATGTTSPVWQGGVCGTGPSTVGPLTLPSTPPTGPFTALVTPGGTTVGSYGVSVSTP